MIDIQALRSHLLEKVFPTLSTGLTYHNVEHTLDVATACREIARRENLNENDTILLRAAALLHDIGFTISFDEHEKESADIASSILPDYGASSSEIELVRGMILATKIPQSPKNKLEEYLCDADLDYLGRDDFEPIAEGLFQEMMFRGLVKSREEWDRIQVKFLSAHKYFSQFSQSSREEKKQENLRSVKDRLKASEV